MGTFYWGWMHGGLKCKTKTIYNPQLFLGPKN